MNKVRSVMTAFLASVVILSVYGWRWTAILPSPKLEAARTVLVLGSLISLAAIALIWKEKPRSAA